ncbi:hypothetical protein [Frankia sp. Cj3]|uniref:hypothetical protein n=1 Tax=Frankia sp. Cj3 TaxID=2880976 RepID=UPI001EF41742|nr:hypothetical protein [Frankia sp. Cj3]
MSAIPAAERVAAALRDVADMVETLGLDDVQIDAYIGWNGETRIGIEPMHTRRPAAQEVRRALDDIAAYTGATLHASHSKGPLWSIYSGYGNEDSGRLPGGAHVYVSQRIPERPLDLAPLPKRRRARDAARGAR